MKHYQRGFIVAILGVIFTTLVKILGEHSPSQEQSGWKTLKPDNFE